MRRIRRSSYSPQPMFFFLKNRLRLQRIYNYGQLSILGFTRFSHVRFVMFWLAPSIEQKHLGRADWKPDSQLDQRSYTTLLEDSLTHLKKSHCITEPPSNIASLVSPPEIWTWAIPTPGSYIFWLDGRYAQRPGSMKLPKLAPHSFLEYFPTRNKS